MITFDAIEAEGVLLVEGHDHDESELRTGLTGALGDRPLTVESAFLSETWYSEEHGFGHDCAAHQDVDREMWSPGCGSFRPVTVAAGIPVARPMERAAVVEVRSAEVAEGVK